MITDIFPGITGFDWDDGNRRKNKEKHAVECFEAEEVFFNDPLILLPDEAHSLEETRIAALGRTNGFRYLTVIFTIRNQKDILIISARNMNKREREFYHER
jgi:uncharacterized DUF497 family protein